MSHVSDFDHRRLDATVFPDCVVEIHHVSDIARGWRKVPVTKIWRKERVLGRGSFGEVHLQVQDTDPRSKRALKVIPTTGRMSNVECERELTALIEFTKPKYKDEAVFVAFLGWFQTENAMYLAMEYIPLGDLESNLQELEKSRHMERQTEGKTRRVLSEKEIKDITTQILEGVKIMHAEGFAHRDLKPQNVLVVQREPHWWVKLGDFGLSKRRTEATAYRSRAGTESYMAPEMFYYVSGPDPDSSEYTNAVDIWALGCITYRILTGSPPFPGLRSLKDYCSSPESPIYLQALSDGELAKDFVRRLLTPQPGQRLTASNALEHTWLSTNVQTATIGISQANQISNNPILANSRPKSALYGTKPWSAATSNSQSQHNYNTASHAGLRSDYPSEEGQEATIRPAIVIKSPEADLSRISEPMPGAVNVERFDSLDLPEDPIIGVIEEQKPKESHTLAGHSGWVQAVAFSPDGKLVASRSGDRTVRLWDAATGAERHTLVSHSGWIVKVERMLRGHSNWVCNVAFSPDGKLVASSSSNQQTVRLWDAATGAVRHTLAGHSSWVQAVAFSPDGKLVASGSYDQTVRLWDAATGAVRHTLAGHSDLVCAVVFSPDGKLVASGSDDWTVRLWDAATGAVRHTLAGHSGRVCAVAFSPDGKLVASGSNDRTVRLWDLG